MGAMGIRRSTDLAERSPVANRLLLGLHDIDVLMMRPPSILTPAIRGGARRRSLGYAEW
jgi:hypothetical protein